MCRFANRSQEEEEKGRALHAKLLTDLKTTRSQDDGDRDGCERRGAGSTGGTRAEGGGRPADWQRGRDGIDATLSAGGGVSLVAAR